MRVSQSAQHALCDQCRSGFWSLLRDDVGMPSDLLPASLLFHPNTCEAKMLGFSGVGHLSAPQYRLAARHDHGITIDADILDLAVEGRDHQEARFDHPQNLLLVYELV